MIDHHRRAHAALARRQVYVKLRDEYVDAAVMRSSYHVWIEHIVHAMGTGHLHVALQHSRSARQLTGRSAGLLD